METKSSSSLIAELDALFGKATSKPKASLAGRKSISSAPTPPREPRFWQPEAVVLYTTSWQCTCGALGDCAPMLAVRERQGRLTRHRAIFRQDQFTNLPREIEAAMPTIIHDCPSCFTKAENHPQLPLPFGQADVSELARFIESGLHAADFAEAVVDPWNTSKLTPELRELRLAMILNLKKESFNHAE